MNELQIIDQRKVLGKDFKIYGDFENPLFLAKDVAARIEHSQADVMIRAVDENEKVLNSIQTLGGVQEAWFLTEDGLYEVLMQSRKPVAKQFKREVKAILRSIRKHGGYLTKAKIEEVMNDPDAWITLLTTLKEERVANERLMLEIEANKPKTLFADAVSVSKTSILVGELASTQTAPVPAATLILPHRAAPVLIRLTPL